MSSLLRWLTIISVLFLGLLPGSSPRAEPQVTVSFIDVGQGDAILIRDGAGFDILIDGGRKSAGEGLIDYMLELGVDDLEIMLATHADSDHIGGLIKVLESDALLVESILFNGYPGDTLAWQEFEAAAVVDGLTLIPIQYPQHPTWGGFDVQVLNPPAGLVLPDQNDASIVLHLGYAQVDILLTADIDASIEQLLPGRTSSLQADILKVAHHGSKYSTSAAFLQAVQPGEAIISVGPNAYDHPTPETLLRLLDAGSSIWRTDLLGTITVVSDGYTYQMLPRVTLLPLILQLHTSPGDP